MWQMVVSVALGVVDWILQRNRDNKEMADLYFKWVERQQGEYLNSKVMRERAKERIKALMDKPWAETPQDGAAPIVQMPSTE
jgi:hypothetical protein